MYLSYYHKRVSLFRFALYKIATPGRANYLLKTGAKLKRAKAVPRKFPAELSILSRHQQENNEEIKKEDED